MLEDLYFARNCLFMLAVAFVVVGVVYTKRTGRRISDATALPILTSFMFVFTCLYLLELGMMNWSGDFIPAVVFGILTFAFGDLMIYEIKVEFEKEQYRLESKP